VPQTEASVVQNGDTPKAHSSEVNAELRVEDTSTLEGWKETALAKSEGHESISQSEPSEKSLVRDEALQPSKSEEDNGQDRSEVASQGPAKPGQMSLGEKQPATEEAVDSSYVPGLLLAELDEAVLKKRLKKRLMTSAELRKEEGSRVESRLTSRIREIKELPAFSEEKVRQMNLIEQYSLDLLSLQKKVRAEVLQELRLKELCVEPDSRIYDWGLMRIRRSGTSYLGYGDPGKYQSNYIVCIPPFSTSSKKIDDHILSFLLLGTPSAHVFDYVEKPYTFFLHNLKILASYTFQT
jgi:hypothetical protein